MCRGGGKLKSRIFCLFAIIILPSVATAQPGWTKKLDGWIDGVYQPLLFAGGNFYSKVSFADIDGDGDYDMFIGGGNTSSFKLLENIGTPPDPIFRLKELVVPGLFGAYGGSTDADFADLDGDNDLDAIVLIDQDRSVGRYMNTGNINNPTWSLPPSNQQIAIGGSGPPSLVDIDGDGDYDLINGLRDSTIYLFVDTSNSGIPYFQQITDHLGHIYIGSIFNMDIADIDNDGDYDIIACVTGGVNKRYENIGGPGNFQFILADSNFLGGQYTPDWLECPELVDIDADGDLDLFLAGAYGRLSYFENIGSPTIPDFIHRYDTTLIYNFPISVARATMLDYDRDGLIDIVTDSLFLHNIGSVFNPRWETVYNYVPNSFKKAYCDIDADGDLDILIPWDAGAVLITNTGTAANPTWDAGHYIVSDSHSIGLYSLAPVDIDDDNDYDLIVFGEATRDFIFYRNVGDSTCPLFEFVTDHYLGLNTTFGQDPAFVDVDHDGDKDLLISNYWNYDLRSKLFYYENIGTPQQAVWDSVTDDYMGWLSSGLMGHAYVGGGDYDSDGDDDIILSYGLGMMLMLNQTIVSIDEDSYSPGNSNSITSLCTKTYPNPFNDEVLLDLVGSISGKSKMEIFNVLGQKIESIGNIDDNHQIRWRAKNNPSGVYFYRLVNGNRCITGKFVLLK
jgi:hypothetical protein